jgi:hypothetical protein
MASSQPSRLHRSRPWFVERRLRKEPDVRYKDEVKRRKSGLVAPVVIFPLLLASGQPPLLAAPGVLAGAFHTVYALNKLKKTPEHFYEKDAAARALLADYRARIAAGTWAGPKYRPAWIYWAPPLSLFIGLQFPGLLHTSPLVGLAAALLVLVPIVVFNMLRTKKEMAALCATFGELPGTSPG